MPAICTYDANGNLTYDGRQDLEIRWNVLNLVSGAETHDDGSLTFSRLSDGTLVARQAVSGGSTAGKRYCGSFVFTTGTGITTPQVESVAWDEGRVFRDSSTGAYRDCWFAGDHLGNVRSVVDISQSLTAPVVLEQNDYLPFGTKVSNSQHAQMGTNRWRYAGKEEFLDLNLLEFGARMYDPFTARWTAVDKEAGKFPNFGSYVYCGSNPILHKELDGEVWDTFIDVGFLAYDVGSAIYHGIKGNHDAAKQSLKNVGEDLLFAAIPGATVAVAKGAKALKNAGHVADAGRSAKNYSRALESMTQGREFEKLILEKVGLKKNTRIFASETKAGEAINVIPDAVTDKYIIEIKHVVKQSYTKQIQGEVNAATKAGKQFVLFVKEDTKLTENLLKMKESGKIRVVYDWRELFTLLN